MTTTAQGQEGERRFFGLMYGYTDWDWSTYDPKRAEFIAVDRRWTALRSHGRYNAVQFRVWFLRLFRWCCNASWVPVKRPRGYGGTGIAYWARMSFVEALQEFGFWSMSDGDYYWNGSFDLRWWRGTWYQRSFGGVLLGASLHPRWYRLGHWIARHVDREYA